MNNYKDIIWRTNCTNCNSKNPVVKFSNDPKNTIVRCTNCGAVFDGVSQDIEGSIYESLKDDLK